MKSEIVALYLKYLCRYKIAHLHGKGFHIAKGFWISVDLETKKAIDAIEQRTKEKE